MSIKINPQDPVVQSVAKAVKQASQQFDDFLLAESKRLDVGEQNKILAQLPITSLSNDRNVSEVNDEILLSQVPQNDNDFEDVPNVEESEFNFDDQFQQIANRPKYILPFQLFIDKSLDLLGRISNLERRSDRLMADYALGKASLEDLSIEKAKVGVAIAFALNLINQGLAAFKEIQNMQI